MIDVKTEEGLVHITFPTKGMSAEQVNDFVNWLRIESIARRSKMTASEAWDLSEKIKATWWEKNKQRFGN